MADEFDSLLSGFTGILMVLMMASIVTSFVAASTPQYCCPLCGNECFFTLDELEQHFATDHPSSPVTVSWD